MKLFTLIASIFLLVISTLHILRIIFSVEIVISGLPVSSQGVLAVAGEAEAAEVTAEAAAVEGGKRQSPIQDEM